ncbi:hypothetical protein DFR24_0066 [Panacagrimonas perspica]|uniref:Uncharacterized protein n=1 Tax=Panacagrimonas perspica TaxID=381431 RepID=A0A4R7PAQ8_9GAMM|nr:hypothetical protein DFR24_0066 [Panacagrimonas perspica]
MNSSALYTLPAITFVAGVMAVAMLCVFGVSIR